MSESQKNQNDPANPWGWQLWTNHMNWKDQLHRKASHKALGIPEGEDLQVTNANQSQNGLGWKELAVIGATALGGGALYNNWNWGLGRDNPPAATSPVDSEYEVRFYDANGNLIEIPNISERK